MGCVKGLTQKAVKGRNSALIISCPKCLSPLIKTIKGEPLTHEKIMKLDGCVKFPIMWNAEKINAAKTPQEKARIIGSAVVLEGNLHSNKIPETQIHFFKEIYSKGTATKMDAEKFLELIKENGNSNRVKARAINRVQRIIQDTEIIKNHFKQFPAWKPYFDYAATPFEKALNELLIELKKQ